MLASSGGIYKLMAVVVLFGSSGSSGSSGGERGSSQLIRNFLNTLKLSIQIFFFREIVGTCDLFLEAWNSLPINSIIYSLRETTHFVYFFLFFIYFLPRECVNSKKNLVKFPRGSNSPLYNSGWRH